jgi:hypothetical protein
MRTRLSSFLLLVGLISFALFSYQSMQGALEPAGRTPWFVLFAISWCSIAAGLLFGYRALAGYASKGASEAMRARSQKISLVLAAVTLLTAVIEGLDLVPRSILEAPVTVIIGILLLLQLRYHAAAFAGLQALRKERTVPGSLLLSVFLAALVSLAPFATALIVIVYGLTHFSIGLP